MIPRVQIQPGHLLIAKPHLAIDRDFGKSVILITAVNAAGVVGFILNKPLRIQLSDILENPANDLKVFNGGPVESENLFFIHSLSQHIDGGLQIRESLYWGGNFESTLALLNQQGYSPTQIQFFMGYSGWTYEQLQEEIAEGSWIVLEDYNLKEVLEHPSATLWKHLIAQQGNAYLAWVNTPDDPRLN